MQSIDILALMPGQRQVLQQGEYLHPKVGDAGEDGHQNQATSDQRPATSDQRPATSDSIVEAVYRARMPRPFDGTIALAGVTFGYAETQVLRNLDLAIAEGERVAVLGPNGAGKSTIAWLILALDRPREGTVFAGGRPLDELDLSAIRRQIGVVLQDAAILPGTIRENVAFGRPGITAAQIEWSRAHASRTIVRSA